MNKCCICAAIKGFAHHLNPVFLNMDKIGAMFDDYRVVLFFDHDEPSWFIDNTLEVIQNYVSRNNKVTLIINPTPLPNDAPKTHKIAHARNGCLQFIREHCPTFQYFIVMDSDDVNVNPIKINVLQTYLERTDWDALSFTRSGNYYDLWALSTRELIYSCWHFQKPHALPIYQNAINNALKDCPTDGLIQVYSAFGGFGIYRTHKFIDCVYDGHPRLDLIPPFLLKKNIELCGEITPYQWLPNPDQDCEHRSFHIQAKIKNNAKIAIAPVSIFD